VKGLRDEQLAQAKIDDTRLFALAKAASRLAFDKQTGGVPVCLFKHLETLGEKYEEHGVNLKYERGALTKPLMTQLAADEEEWFADSMKMQVSRYVMFRVIQQAMILTVDAASPEKYWEQVKKAAASVEGEGFEPILLLENRTRPSWVWDWGWFAGQEDRHKRPNDLRITRRESHTTCDEYVGHFNEIAVYQAPISVGSSVLFPRQILKCIFFTKFENGYSVNVSWERHADPNFVNLKLAWAQRIELEDYPITRLQYH
jgi:hypothetical protein